MPFVVKACAFACALLLPVQAIPQTTKLNRAKVAQLPLPADPSQPDIVFQNYPLVHRVDCREGRGSAVRVGPRHFLSVAHVTALHDCTVEGKPITVTEQDGNNDFSQFDVDLPAPNAAKIDCDGFKPGHWYWAVGFAGGRDFQTAVAIYATIYKAENGQRVFIGRHTVIPGQSGGMVVDPETSAEVGTVNAYNPMFGISLSRELRDTSVCKEKPNA